MKKLNIFLDLDELLTDFFSATVRELNKMYGTTVTIEEYVTKWGKWDMATYFKITNAQFWRAIESNPRFWRDLEPLPWASELLSDLTELGEVTIVTSPSTDPECSKQKLQWLRYHYDISSTGTILGARKYLLAGNGILIDDSPSNVNHFREAGGTAILVPAKWNTLNLDFEMVWTPIKTTLDEITN